MSLDIPFHDLFLIFRAGLVGLEVLDSESVHVVSHDCGAVILGFGHKVDIIKSDSLGVADE